MRVALLGPHQLHNTCTVLETVEALRERGWKIPDEAVHSGLASVKWPARMEVLGRSPLFLLDGGHNPQCAQALAEAIDKLLPGKKVVFLLGVLAGAAVSFVIASPIVRTSDVSDLAAAQSAVSAMKSGDAPANAEAGFGDKIIFACDAGMGSSAMGATRFRNRIKLDRPDLIVEHASVDEVPADAKIVVVQANLADRARKSAPNAQFVVINNFLTDPNLDALYNNLVAAAAAAGGTAVDPAAAQAAAEAAAQQAQAEGGEAENTQ
jgi:galactitol-specific phosphotransferase system IIB component